LASQLEKLLLGPNGSRWQVGIDHPAHHPTADFDGDRGRNEAEHDEGRMIPVDTSAVAAASVCSHCERPGQHRVDGIVRAEVGMGGNGGATLCSGAAAAALGPGVVFAPAEPSERPEVPESGTPDAALVLLIDVLVPEFLGELGRVSGVRETIEGPPCG